MNINIENIANFYREISQIFSRLKMKKNLIFDNIFKIINYIEIYKNLNYNFFIVKILTIQK